MSKDTPMIIPKNPAQIPASQFKLTRNMKVRGDAIYIIFSGIVASVVMFCALMDISAILALSISWLPLVIAIWFYFRFVREKPKYYFDYWMNGLLGKSLRVNIKKIKRIGEDVK